VQTLCNKKPTWLLQYVHFALTTQILPSLNLALCCGDLSLAFSLSVSARPTQQNKVRADISAPSLHPPHRTNSFTVNGESQPTTQAYLSISKEITTEFINADAIHASFCYAQLILVVQYAEIARDDFVFENSTRRYVDALAVVGYDDHSSLQTKRHSLSHRHQHWLNCSLKTRGGYAL